MIANRGKVIGWLGAASLIILFYISSGKEDRVQPVQETEPTSPYGSCVATALNNEVPTFSRRVKIALRNPDSYEHVSTKIGPVEDGIFGVATTYRATNGFGAVDTGIALGEVRVADCAPKLVSIN